MLDYLLAITGLAAACGGWILFQRWLNKLDPEHDSIETGAAAEDVVDAARLLKIGLPRPIDQLEPISKLANDFETRQNRTKPRIYAE